MNLPEGWNQRETADAFVRDALELWAGPDDRLYAIAPCPGCAEHMGRDGNDAFCVTVWSLSRGPLVDRRGGLLTFRALDLARVAMFEFDSRRHL